MIEYSCEHSASLEQACLRLDATPDKYKVLHETKLGFRKKPSLAAKRILTSCGFRIENVKNPPSEEQLAELQRRSW